MQMRGKSPQCREEALKMNSRWDLAQQNSFYTKQKMTKRQLGLNYKGTIHVYIWNIISDDEQSEVLHLCVCQLQEMYEIKIF